jgi:hypothetical protein
MAVAGMRGSNPCSWASQVGMWGQRAVHLAGAATDTYQAINKAMDGDYIGAALSAATAMANVHLMAQACFTAGVPLLTPEGAKAIELIAVGEMVLSRSQHDPYGVVAGKVVEEVFVRMALVLELVVRGRTIGTTAEHPFFVQRAWKFIPARELEVGDLFLGHDGQWVAVEEIRDTGRYEKVYNLRVADYHTYFVGDSSWGFSVWAHNSYSGDAATKQAEVAAMLEQIGYSPKQAARIAAKYAGSGEPGDSLHANLKAYIEGGGGPYTAPGEYTRGSESPKPRAPKGGVWTGEPGHSNFIPDDPVSLGLNYGEVVPFRNGRPDFSEWSKGNFTANEALTGVEQTDQKIFWRTLRDNFNARDGDGSWTLGRVQGWLQSERVTPHHSGGNDFQLIPWALHGNTMADPPLPGIRHSGMAVELRNN